MRTSRVLGPTFTVVVSLVAAACAEADPDPGPVAPGTSTTGPVSSVAPTTTTTTSPSSPATTSSSPVTTTAPMTSGTAPMTTTGETTTTTGETTTTTGAPTTTTTDPMQSTTPDPVSSMPEPDSSMPDETSEPGPAPGGRAEGPCDIFNAAGTECVAAYSTIRALLSTYDGPLYQVRSGSNVMNTGSGGQTHDIGMTADGFVDKAAHDAACPANTLCTFSKLYDQSGRGNHLTVAKGGQSAGGQTALEDDWESVAGDEQITVAGHDVYSLYMEKHQGYRQTIKGAGVPRGKEAQGIYMLADGTRRAEACCWDFGNVTENPKVFHEMNTLFFGKGYWGVGAGSGPWFMNDFEAGVWAGGTNEGDPGWGSLNGAHPPNPNNPSLPVKYAIGFTKTDGNADKWALSMADLSTANMLTVAYEGGLPRDGGKIKGQDNQGAIVLGVGGDNSNNSWGTFYEGAVVAGYPSGATENAVMQNVKAAGYGQ